MIIWVLRQSTSLEIAFARIRPVAVAVINLLASAGGIASTLRMENLKKLLFRLAVYDHSISGQISSLTARQLNSMTNGSGRDLYMEVQVKL